MIATASPVAVVVLIALYCLPSILAFERKHHAIWSIVVVNLLLGWTLIGWVVALAWAVGPVRTEERS